MRPYMLVLTFADWKVTAGCVLTAVTRCEKLQKTSSMQSLCVTFGVLVVAMVSLTIHW